VLRGYESVKVTMDFSPLKQGLYSARAALLLLVSASASTQLVPADASGLAPGGSAGARLVHVTPTALEYGAAAAAELDAAEEQQQGPTGSSSDQDASTGSSRLACEKLILTVVGEATQGALCIEPASLALGNINVGYPQRKTLKLVNQSAGVLRYHVTVVDECPAGIDCAEVACEFGSASAVRAEPMSDAAGNSISAAGTAGSGSSSEVGAVADCCLDAPEGLVNAR
jgi:hypothetical protein